MLSDPEKRKLYDQVRPAPQAGRRQTAFAAVCLRQAPLPSSTASSALTARALQFGEEGLKAGGPGGPGGPGGNPGGGPGGASFQFEAGALPSHTYLPVVVFMQHRRLPVSRIQAPGVCPAMASVVLLPC